MPKNSSMSSRQEAQFGQVTSWFSNVIKHVSSNSKSNMDRFLLELTSLVNSVFGL